MAIIYGARTDRLINALDGVTNGADTILGDGEAESIYGLGGDDVIKGGGGADRLYGGAGIDTAVYSDSDEGVWVSLTAGRGLGGTAEGDQLFEIENVTGSAYRDELYGNSNDNTLNGDGGDDLIKGGGGSDRLSGGTGNDTLEIDGLGDDYVDGGSGNDTLSFGYVDPHVLHGVTVSLASGHATLGPSAPSRFPADPPEIVNVENVVGTEANDRISGNDVDNILLGYGGFDRLSGGQGNDTIDGGDGGDWIWGDEGDDHLWGGAGADRFYLERHEGAVDLGHDVIADFGLGDQIVVDDTISFATIRAGMRQVGDDVVITFDADNSITLENTRLSSVTSSDFLFE